MNVFLPVRGLAEHEILFEDCLDMLHDVFIKYRPTHTIICGGDFNASLHRDDRLRRDMLLYSFLSEHGIQMEASYPVEYTFFHTPNNNFSQIDLFFVLPLMSDLVYQVEIPEVHHLHQSDIAYIEIYLEVASNLVFPEGAPVQIVEYLSQNKMEQA